METILSVQNLRKSYKDVEAVKGISFEVMKGQLFAFLGPNGAGKSTTIDILCTLLKAGAGEVEVNGNKLGKADQDIKRSIGVVFQDSLLDPTLTVRENLEIRGSLYALSKKELEEMIEVAVRTTGIEDLLDRPYGKLSGGQRRRSDIARGLIHRPEILFLDEPTTGLDPQTRKSVWETLAKIQEETDMTVFLTTHYMEEAAQADYISIIDHGEIVAEGTPAYLKEEYTSDIVTMQVNNTKEVEKVLADNAYEFTLNKNKVTVAVPSTLASLPLLEATREYIDSFEVQTGSMDDVFIAITGKEIRA